MIIPQVFLLLFFFLTTYVYFGYPALLMLLARLKSRPVNKEPISPPVSLIITAHNEEKVIHNKLQNALSMDYPRDKLEIIVASDGSDDATDNIVRTFAPKGVKLCFYPREGKAMAQNKTVPLAEGEIILFSDADSLYRSDAVAKLLRNFSDHSVGGVSGQLMFTNPDASSTSQGQSLYWRYEKLLRTLEAGVSSCIMAHGGIFALRKELFEPLDPGFSEDFVLPLRIAARGYRVVFEPEAVSYEKMATTSGDEFRQKIRNVHGDSYGMFKLKCMLSPLRPFLAFQCISHKLLRWAVGAYLAAMFISNLFLLNIPFYQATMALQALFYLSAAAGFLLHSRNIKTPLYIPYYFTLVNAALLVGLWRTLRGKPYVTIWETAKALR